MIDVEELRLAGKANVLYGSATTGGLLTDAADEIDRLRAAVGAAESFITSVHKWTDGLRGDKEETDLKTWQVAYAAVKEGL